MKRILLIIAALVLTCTSYAGKPGSKVGIIGGLTSSQTNLKDLDASQAGFHAGFTARSSSVLGFALQTGLLYNQKGTQYKSVNEAIKEKVGYVEFPVQLQYGVDLLLFRPYAFVEPFIGYAVNNSVSYGEITIKNQWDGVNRFEYGLGLGAGLDLGKDFQLSFKYFWNFDNASIDGTLKEVASAWWSSAKSSLSDGASFNGLMISLSILF